MNGDRPMITVSSDDPEELIELLDFLDDWLGRDYHRAGTSMFTHSYDVADLRHDLVRFIFLLGGPADRFIQGTRQ